MWERKRIIICTLPPDQLLQDCFFFWERAVLVDHVYSDRKNLTFFYLFRKIATEKVPVHVILSRKREEDWCATVKRVYNY